MRTQQRGSCCVLTQRGDYTESYQELYHEQIWKQIKVRSYLWATYVWNLYDFGADGRDEGGRYAQNQKGPFVHLCGRRYVDRAEDMTEIRVYSKQKEVTLYLDGQAVDTQEDYAISNNMLSYFTNFIKYGDSNSDGLSF